MDTFLWEKKFSMNHICPIECRHGAIEILEILRSAGFETYFAGGCVRDRLLSSAPTEYDIATSARPDDISKLFPKARSVGESFGVMIVRKNSSMYDVATFRSDGPYSDKRHPDEITFSDAKHDALRRDFTINGMFEDPIEDKIIDFVGGKEDLQNRIIKSIGDPNERISEDHLRMLRAIRFASRFEFSIEADVVFLSMGFIGPEKMKILKQLEVEQDKRTNVIVNELGNTGLENVFATGDIVSGASLVVRALEAGKITARHIDNYLLEK